MYASQKRLATRLTRYPTVKLDFGAVPALVATSQMEGLVQVTHEVHEELQSLLSSLVVILKPHRRVAHGRQNVMAWRPLPTFVPEYTVLRLMVANPVHIVQDSGPVHMHANFVCPCCYGCEMTVGVFR